MTDTPETPAATKQTEHVALPSRPSLLFDGINDWLISQGLLETPLEDIVKGFGHRLVAGGVPVHRIGVASMVLHPVIGGLNLHWSADTDSVSEEHLPRDAFGSPAFRDSPYFDLMVTNRRFVHYRLTDADNPDLQGEVYQTFRDRGMVDYLGFFETYGRPDAVLWAELPAGIEGVVGSFMTRRASGFTDDEVAYIKALSRTFALAVKTATTQMLSRVMLETYLGKVSGDLVLDGVVSRGDGRLIDCALWFADLRGSTALASHLPLEDYLATLNDYFECTANAVMDHGGEVLKFIGDAVLAIFPFEDETRPPEDMARAAAAAARDALARRDAMNEKRAIPLQFGIGLHVGQVMYGNVGTTRRLDFTATGVAVNEVTRLEGLTKKLKTPIVASKAFANLYPEPLNPLGRQDAAGIDGGLEVFGVNHSSS
ncbi:MAG: adenylate/guanylate cyclase domain-containing protein [Alphaproteobacteria bacterium]|jgi:adenylate cyclase|nr:adenylate/guanylate cyclase domain-containing protein [Alphaproteobacteria bacterium]